MKFLVYILNSTYFEGKCSNFVGAWGPVWYPPLHECGGFLSHGQDDGICLAVYRTHDTIRFCLRITQGYLFLSFMSFFFSPVYLFRRELKDRLGGSSSAGC